MHSQVDVRDENGQLYQALTYVAGTEYVCEEQAPSDKYLGRILKGAREHGLPKDYIKSIEQLARGVRT